MDHRAACEFPPALTNPLQARQSLFEQISFAIDIITGASRPMQPLRMHEAAV